MFDRVLNALFNANFNFLWPRNLTIIFSPTKRTLAFSFWNHLDTQLKLTTCKNVLLKPVVAETQSFLKKITLS